jgi:hypothetical protein
LDCSYCYLVFTELINRNTKAAWSVQWSYIPSGRSLVVFPFAVGLHRVDLSHFFVFFFRNKCFIVDGELAHRTTPWRRRTTHWWSFFSHPVIPLQSTAPIGSDAVRRRSSGDQTLLFPSPSLAARIWDPPAGWLPLASTKN